MRIESLSCFLEVVRTGSFRKAAQNLYLSQQGLSKSICSLEAELNCSLFYRNKKRVSLTDAGRILKPYAQTIVDNRHELDVRLTEHRLAVNRQLSSRLAIFASPLATARILPSLEQEIGATGLDKVTITEYSLSKIVRHMVESDTPTLALVDLLADDISSFTEEHPDLIYDYIASASITVLGVRELLGSDRTEITLDELRHLPIAYYNAPILNHAVERILGNSPDNIVMRVSNSSMIYELVCKGAAVTISDTFSDHISKQHCDLISIPISGISPASMGFLYRSDIPLSNDQQTYIELFKSVIYEIIQKHSGESLLDPA